MVLTTRHSSSSNDSQEDNTDPQHIGNEEGEEQVVMDDDEDSEGPSAYLITNLEVTLRGKETTCNNFIEIESLNSTEPRCTECGYQEASGCRILYT